MTARELMLADRYLRLLLCLTPILMPIAIWLLYQLGKMWDRMQ